MAEAGPYGITQVDVAGVLNNYQNARANRIQMMLAQKQIEKLDRESKNEDATSKAVSAYYGGNSSPASSGASSPSTASSVPAAYGAPTQAAPQAASQSTMPSNADREKLFSTLLAINPTVASQYADAFSKMDKVQADKYQQTSDKMVQFFGGLLQLPQGQRAAALQQAAPELQQLGITPDHLAQADVSDEGLRRIIVSHQDASKVMEFVKPEIHSVTQGGSLVQSTPSGQTKTLYESPTVAGPNGEVFARPGAASDKPQTATNPRTGEKVQFNPQSNRWEPVGGQSVAPAGGFQ